MKPIAYFPFKEKDKRYFIDHDKRDFVDHVFTNQIKLYIDNSTTTRIEWLELISQKLREEQFEPAQSNMEASFLLQLCNN